MRRALQILLAFVLLGGIAKGQNGDWASLGKIKGGSTIVVETTREYGSVGYDRCQLVSVDAQDLTCKQAGQHGARLVFPQRMITTVLLRRNPKLSVGKMILYGGLGFVLGAMLTDDRADIPVALLGSGAGAVAGLFGGNKQERLIIVYRAAQP